MSDTNNYEEIPVKYCAADLSLKIIQLEGTNINYCGNCGNTYIKETSITDWEEKYIKKYGRRYI